MYQRLTGLGFVVVLAFKWENTSVGRHKMAMASRSLSAVASERLAFFSYILHFLSDYSYANSNGVGIKLHFPF